MSNASTPQAHLLEIFSAGNTARVSLWPAHTPLAATLSGYDEIALDRRELERIVYELRVLLGRANMRGQLDDATVAEIRKLGHLLFDELLPGRVKDWLRLRDGGDLLIRTDESLVGVPWEMLHTGQNFLAMQMNIGRLIASPDVLAPTTPRTLNAPYDVLVLADPCGDLDAAYEEGIRLRDRLDGQPYLRVTLQSSEVSRAYVRENIREVDILHFAGHAEVAGKGDGWLLSDGRFAQEDVARLTGGRPFPSLVFANACGSGRSGRAIHGAGSTWSLARTFLGAGVRHFIGTHWDVPDVIASDFAEHFYRGLCAGLSIGSAMREARAAISVTHGQGAILWGSYCLYGDPHHVYFPEAGDFDTNQSWDDDLPVLDVEEDERIRPIRHTMDVPVAELINQAPPEPGLGLNPNLRSEAALRGPAFGGVQDLTRPLMITAAVASALLVAAIAHQLWSMWTPPSGPTPSVAMIAPIDEPVDEPKDRAPAPEPNPAVAEHILEQEEAQRKTPPRVEFAVTAQTRTSQKDIVEVLVNEGTRLRSGDNLRVSLDADRDVYVALIMIDGRHKPQLLFPHPSVRNPNGNHLPAGQTLQLPGDQLWYRLDRNPGVETLVLLASRQPLGELEDFIDEVAMYGKAARRHKGRSGGVVVRGVGGLKEGRKSRPSKRDKTGQRTRQLVDIQTMATSRGIEVVQAVTYIHVR